MHELILYLYFPYFSSHFSSQKRKGTLGKRSRNAAELLAQDKGTLQRKYDENERLIKKHQHRVLEHLKFRSRRRFKSLEELEGFLEQNDPVDGMEYSYAMKCEILREQVQLRKKLDGIKKIGDVTLHNCSGKEYPEPLAALMGMFKLICSHELVHGIPPPIKPELVQRRKGRAAEDSLATELLKRQHKEAAALTNAFYNNHNFDGVDGQFVAYKMTRTLVKDPRSYVGLAVQRKFTEDNLFYKGTIVEYYDPKQWWTVHYDDGDAEDWGVAEMRKWIPTFKCGPVVDGVTERSASALRQRLKQRREKGRQNPLSAALQEVINIQASAESGRLFELPEKYHESAGTVWKLLKVSVEDDGSRWGAYIAADDAACVDDDDIKNLSLNELKDSYDVELAPLEDIESWIQSSAILTDVVEDNPNVRRSSRIKRALSNR